MSGFSECRPFLVHLRSEHERLQTDVGEVEEALQSCTDGTPTLKVWARLSRLRSELKQHFEEEERGGCIDEALGHCPRLACEATHIERQHPELLQQLDQLIERVGGEDSDIDAGFVRDFAEFSRALRAHEVAEDRLLREAFGCTNEDV